MLFFTRVMVCILQSVNPLCTASQHTHKWYGAMFFDFVFTQRQHLSTLSTFARIPGFTIQQLTHPPLLAFLGPFLFFSKCAMFGRAFFWMVWLASPWPLAQSALLLLLDCRRRRWLEIHLLLFVDGSFCSATKLFLLSKLVSSVLALGFLIRSSSLARQAKTHTQLEFKLVERSCFALLDQVFVLDVHQPLYSSAAGLIKLTSIWLDDNISTHCFPAALAKSHPSVKGI